MSVVRDVAMNLAAHCASLWWLRDSSVQETTHKLSIARVVLFMCTFSDKRRCSKVVRSVSTLLSTGSLDVDCTREVRCHQCEGINHAQQDEKDTLSSPSDWHGRA